MLFFPSHLNDSGQVVLQNHLLFVVSVLQVGFIACLYANIVN